MPFIALTQTLWSAEKVVAAVTGAATAFSPVRCKRVGGASAIGLEVSGKRRRSTENPSGLRAGPTTGPRRGRIKEGEMTGAIGGKVGRKSAALLGPNGLITKTKRGHRASAAAAVTAAEKRGS